MDEKHTHANARSHTQCKQFRGKPGAGIIQRCSRWGHQPA